MQQSVVFGWMTMLLRSIGGSGSDIKKEKPRRSGALETSGEQ
jgi:hypothetical protein